MHKGKALVAKATSNGSYIATAQHTHHTHRVQAQVHGQPQVAFFFFFFFFMPANRSMLAAVPLEPPLMTG